MSLLADLLGDTIREARARFPDVDFLRPGGELHVDLAPTVVDRVRVDLDSSSAPLHLQSLGLTTTDGLAAADLATRGTITASSWRGTSLEDFEPLRLFDADHPSGHVIHTEVEDHPWVEATFDEPVELTAVHLRGIDQRAISLARNIRVHVGAPGADLVTVHDATRRRDELTTFLGETVDRAPDEVRAEYGVLVEPLGLALTGRYREARAVFKALKKSISDDTARTYRQAVNQGFLLERSLEWTTHGPLRSFRFWTEPEKLEYIRFAVSVADALRELTPNVCFGYGAALAVVRDHDLIPHDDDLDLIIAFEPDEAATLPEAHARVEEFLRARGFVVKGDFFGHRHVSIPGGKHVDVFSGLFEGDRVSWYPGTRGALERSTMFPSSQADLLGVACPLPADPVAYLSTIYGPGWSTPDPGFKHDWRKKAFADQAVAATQAAPSPAAAPSRSWLSRLLRR